MKKVIILGNGFVAKALNKLYPQAFIFGNQPTDINFFEFLDEKTWSGLPKKSSLCIITLKLTSLQQTNKIYHNILAKYSKIIILSSTGTYKIKQPNQTIDESCPRDKSQIRVICEDYLLKKGAMILCLPLIYGYERNLKKWLKQGRIQNGNKLINLIYINDLTHCLKRLARQFENGIFNLCDGEKHTWQTIADSYSIKLDKKPIDKKSKFISNKKLLDKFKYNFRNYVEL